MILEFFLVLRHCRILEPRYQRYSYLWYTCTASHVDIFNIGPNMQSILIQHSIKYIQPKCLVPMFEAQLVQCLDSIVSDGHSSFPTTSRSHVCAKKLVRLLSCFNVTRACPCFSLNAQFTSSILPRPTWPWSCPPNQSPARPMP